MKIERNDFNQFINESICNLTSKKAVYFALTTVALCTLATCALYAQAAPAALSNKATQIASNQAQLLEKIQQQLTSGDISNILYQIQENQQLIQIRVVMPVGGKINLGGLIMSVPNGAVILCHNGASSELIQAIREMAELSGHPVKMTLGGLINGKNSIDLFI